MSYLGAHPHRNIFIYRMICSRSIASNVFKESEKAKPVKREPNKGCEENDNKI